MILTLIFCLIAASAFFSGSEAALLRLRASKVSADAQKNFLAKIARRLLKNIDTVLPMILLGNTFANILVGSLLSTYLQQHEVQGTLLILAPVFLTLFILIFAEVLPKTLATLFAEKIAYTTSPILTFLYFILQPLTFLLSKVNSILLFLLGVQGKHKADFITRDEYKVMIEEGSVHNKQFHHALMMGILELSELDVNHIMTRRDDIDVLNLEHDLQTIKKSLRHTSHDTLIVIDGHIDKVLGTISSKEAWYLYQDDHITTQRLLDLLVKPYYIPEKISIPRQWQQFHLHDKKVAIIVNEYGETLGLVTKHDIVQEIFVNSQSEAFNSIDLGISQITKNTWILDGSTSCHHIKKLFKWPMPEDQADTIGGSLMNYLESLPQPGCSVKIQEVIYEIMQVNQHKILKVKIIDQRKV